MEILILLIVVAFLAGVTLGPIALFKISAMSDVVTRLDRQVDRLNERLQRVEVVCAQLRGQRMSGQMATRDEKETSEGQVKEKETRAAEEPGVSNDGLATAAQQPVAEPEPKNDADDDASLSTLERLRELRQQEQNKLRAEAEAKAQVEKQAEVVEQASAAAVDIPDRAEPSESIQPFTPAPASFTTTAQHHDSDEPKRRLTIEEVLAGKVFVWIGAVALVLTAGFLLKLGFDRNIITEPVRVIAAGVFGVALWCVGEWARGRVGLIAQALCGAAVAVLYGTILAGDHYQLLGPSSGVAFGLMALVTGAAVLLSLRHGPAVAILGMLGGFMLPPFLTHDFGPSTGMILYLLAIEVGVLAVTGRRGWFGISVMTLFFTIAWSLGYTLIGDNAYERTLTAFLVLGTAAAYLVHTARIHRDPNSEPRTRLRVLGLSIAATCSAIGIVALLAVRGDYTPRDLGMLGLIAAGTIVLSRLDARQLAMPFVAMGLSLLVLVSNAAQALPAAPSSTLIVAAACFGGLFMIGGYVCMWGSPRRRAFAVMCAIAGPIFFGVVVFAGHEAYGLRQVWWPYTLSLAGVYALAAVPLFWRRKVEYDWPIALFAVLSFALVCVTLTQATDHPWLAVCLALVSAAAALVDLRLFIRPLRLAACAVAAGSAVLLIVPGPFDLVISGSVVFNTLLPMYLLPALSFGVIAWCASRAGSTPTATRMTHLCCATLGVMLVVLTRQAYHPLDFLYEGFALYEWATLACVLMLGALLGHLIADLLQLDAVRASAIAAAGVGAAVAVIGGLVPGNPLLTDQASAGSTLAISLLGLYLAPAALIWLWSRRASLTNYGTLPGALRVGSIGLIAGFVALQIRNALHFDDLHAHTIGHYECATYGLAWVALGLLLCFISPRCTLRRTTHRAGGAVFGMGVAILIVGNAVILNPLWARGAVGALPVFNGLWYLYGPTILILATLARHARRHNRPTQARLAGFTAIAMAFMLMSMFVRHGFSGDGMLLLTDHFQSAERYAYSLAWVLFGGVLLVAGVFTRLDTLRYGSLAVLLLAVGKVFLIDTANLDNLYRVFSFFGLGVTLIALGYLYQRLVFRRSNPNDKGEAA